MERPEQEPSQQMGSNLVPTLNKESWELIELRLWSSFSKKLWVVLTAALTLAALLGLLGIDAWLKLRVEESLRTQRDEYERNRAKFQSQMEEQLLAASSLLTLQNRFLLDLGKLKATADRLQAGLSRDQLNILQQTTTFTNLLNGFTAHRIAPDAFEKDWAVIQNLPQGALDSPTINAGAALNELHLGYWHLQGLRAAIAEAKKDVFVKAGINSSAALDYYEKKIYPKYAGEMIKSRRTVQWTSSMDSSFSSLDPDPRKELGRFTVSTTESKESKP